MLNDHGDPTRSLASNKKCYYPRCHKSSLMMDGIEYWLTWMYYAESAQLLQVFNMQIRGRIERGADGLHHARPLSARRCHVCCKRGTRCVCLYSNHKERKPHRKEKKRRPPTACLFSNKWNRRCNRVESITLIDKMEKNMVILKYRERQKKKSSFEKKK